MAGRQTSAREAYYEAVMELGIARDGRQVRIGEYLSAVQEARKALAGRAPSRMLERFDELESLTTKQLTDDLLGDEPND